MPVRTGHFGFSLLYLSFVPVAEHSSGETGLIKTMSAVFQR